MNDAVLDASVLLKWFTSGTEDGEQAAAELRRRFEDGSLDVLVPSLIFLEVLNVAGRRWGWDGAALDEFATAIGDIPLDVMDPDLSLVAEWVARGLTAYDAAYVSLAEEMGIPLVTDDAAILRVAADHARPLGAQVPPS